MDTQQSAVPSTPTWRRWPRTRAQWANAGLSFAAGLLVLVTIGVVIAPLFADLSKWGGHDWDQMAVHRYVTVKSILRYHQFPFWNPYSCGGHPQWGGIEAATTVVSPFLLPYLLLSLPVALRLEVVGALLIAAWGTWLLAGRFTTSSPARAFACVVFVVNGRWALQAAAGHMWHSFYALTPWAFYFLDKACSPPQDGSDRQPWLRNAVYASFFFALMVYSGAIYPLPQTAVLAGFYCLFLAVKLRDWRPLAALSVAGILGGALAAPKMLPLMSVIADHPRLVESNETVDPRILVAAMTGDAVAVPQWGWHEYGIYVGWPAFFILLLALLAAKTYRELSVKWIALIAIVAGLGRFHEFSPWALLHDNVPIFKSLHVPSRWLYPAVLLVAVLACSVAERWLQRVGKYRAILEVLILAGVALVAYDISSVARPIMQTAFTSILDPHTERLGSFHTEKLIPPNLRYQTPGYAPPELPAAIENVGVIECTTDHAHNIWARDAQGNAPGMGAKGKGDSAYRGEVYTASGVGSAEILYWSPNLVSVRAAGAKPGDLLVLNQNWDPGWLANGKLADKHADTVAVRLSAPEQTVVFRYRSPRFWLGVTIALSALLLCALVRLRFWRWAKRLNPARA